MAAKPKRRVTFVLLAVGALTDASSFYPHLDRVVCWVMAGGMGAMVVYSIGWWFVGEWLLGWECRCPVPRNPRHTPLYAKPQEHPNG